MNPDELLAVGCVDSFNHLFCNYDKLIDMVTQYWQVEDFNPRQKFPLTNFYVNEKNGTFRIKCALAGYDKNDLSVKAEGCDLIISSSASEKEDKEFKVMSQSIRQSNFEYRIPMNQKFDISKAEVSYSNGILTIDVPVKEESLPKNLKIN